MSDRLDISHAYSILELQMGASLEEVKKAYRQLVKIWHPDCFTDLQEKQEAEKKIKEINDAYELIKNHIEEFGNIPQSDATNRNDSGKKSGKSPNSSTRVSAYRADAKTFYEWGVENVNKGDYEQAIADFTGAIRLDPNYVEAYKYRGYVCSLKGYEHRANADLRKAAQLEGESAYPSYRSNSRNRKVRNNSRKRSRNNTRRYTQSNSRWGDRVVYQRQYWFTRIWLRIKSWLRSIFR